MVAELKDNDWQSGLEQLKLPKVLHDKLRAAIVAFKNNSESPFATLEEFNGIADVVFFIRFKPSGICCILEYKNKRLRLTKESTQD